MSQKQYRWATEEIYSSPKEFEKELESLKSRIDFSCFKGKLNQKESFLQCMKKQEELLRKLEKLSVYAMMKHDEDTSNSVSDAMNAKVTSFYAEVASSLAFIEPELTAIDEEVLKSYIEDKDLADYDYSLKRVLEQKNHVLSEKEEKLLASLSETLSSFRDIFTKLDNADLKYSAITHNGKKYPLSHGTYGVLMHQGDRKLREKAFKKYYKGYVNLINGISANYYGNVKKNVFSAKARNYSSSLEQALAGEDVDVLVYHNLLESVNQALPILHRYMSVKKKELGFTDMHMYDVYVPLDEGAELKLDYEEAYQLVIDGLSVLGEDYVNLLKRAKEERWIDVYETPNKRSGAYSVCVYDTHPYVLLNYQKTTHDVFTIAHEMGHSIHSYFSNANQPYNKADYKIFVAEVASTVNEVLLVKYLLKNAEDEALKKYLLYYLMEMIRTTLFRQTQFSEFEEYAHGQVEKGQPLTKDSLSEAYLKLNEKYYGNAVVSDNEIKYEWARIPHFYRAFYVYKYATGIISALAIADRILTEGKPAIDDYFKFLSSGGSDSPVELLKIAGVDLKEKSAFDRAFKVFKDALEEYERL